MVKLKMMKQEAEWFFYPHWPVYIPRTFVCIFCLCCSMYSTSAQYTGRCTNLLLVHAVHWPPVKKNIRYTGSNSSTVCSNTVRSNTVRSNTVRSNTVRLNTVRSNTVRSNTVRLNTVRLNTVRSNIVRSNKVRSNTVRSNTICIKKI